MICQAYVEGVSTRRVEDLVKSMGIDGMSKSQVSELAKNIDTKVAEFRNRPLDARPYTYIWLDALFHKVREGGRVVSRHLPRRALASDLVKQHAGAPQPGGPAAHRRGRDLPQLEPSSAWPVPSLPNRTMSGQWHGATCRPSR